MGTVEHKHPSKAAEEHPVRVCAHLHCDTGSQHHKHCTDSNSVKRASDVQRQSEIGGKQEKQINRWRGSHSRGQTARPEESCCWFFWPASRRWHPMTGRQTVPLHTAGTPREEPETTHTYRAETYRHTAINQLQVQSGFKPRQVM